MILIRPGIVFDWRRYSLIQAQISATSLREMSKDRCKTSWERLNRRFLPDFSVAIVSALLCLLLITAVQGQELVRSSAAAPFAEFKRTPGAFFYLGPFQEDLTGTATVRYTDNVELTKTDKISDLSFEEGLSLDTTWVISHLNQVEFTLGGRLVENFYGNGQQQTYLDIDPDSKIEFKFEISDVKVRFFDRFAYVQNPTTDPTATGTANLNELTNTIGAEVTSDLSIALLSLLADYTYNTESGSNVQGQNQANTTGTRETFRFTPTLAFQWTPTIQYGLTATASRSSGQDDANVNSFSAGPFIKGKLSRDLEFELSAGFNRIETKPAVAPAYYVTGALRYQINRYWQLLLSASHDTIFTVGTGLSEENVFKLGTQLGITRFITFTLSPYLNFGTVETTSNQVTVNSAANQLGPYTQVGIEASLGWQLRKRWRTVLTYGYVHQNSSPTINVVSPGLASTSSYVQNTISLSLSYDF
jgi:hypothetical protein